MVCDVFFLEGVVWLYDDVGNVLNSWLIVWCWVIWFVRKSFVGKVGGGWVGLVRWYYKEGRGNDVIGMG